MDVDHPVLRTISTQLQQELGETVPAMVIKEALELVQANRPLALPVAHLFTTGAFSGARSLPGGAPQAIACCALQPAGPAQPARRRSPCVLTVPSCDTPQDLRQWRSRQHQSSADADGSAAHRKGGVFGSTVAYAPMGACEGTQWQQAALYDSDEELQPVAAATSIEQIVGAPSAAAGRGLQAYVYEGSATYDVPWLKRSCAELTKHADLGYVGDEVRE